MMSDWCVISSHSDIFQGAGLVIYGLSLNDKVQYNLTATSLVLRKDRGVVTGGCGPA